MKIGTRDLAERILIVAEIGNNHEGSFPDAEALVRKAALCGVDAVKFQTFQTDLFVSRKDAARHERLKKFELTQDQFRDLGRLAKSLGLLFVSTPLDLPSALFLSAHVDAFKIASGDNDFFPLMERTFQSGRPVIVSTGASTCEMLDRTIAFARDKMGSAFAESFALLHCTSAYPAPLEDLQLRAIPFLASRYHCPIGYSDHSLGLDACLAAVPLGACIIEKHFTLDKNHSDFRDHKLSADPADMAELVRRIRGVESMLGKPGKSLQPSEVPTAAAIRRSIVAARELPAGHVLAPDDLAWIRPAGGLNPGEEFRLVGRSLKRSVESGERIMMDDVAHPS
ncbi:MAG: N-acetylneuraminate synthase family protein [Candidatus Hydrogenedentota bacterium]